jgi:hypothetical protein
MVETDNKLDNKEIISTFYKKEITTKKHGEVT